MKGKNYQTLRIAIVRLAIEDAIRTSGEEYGMSWDEDWESDLSF